MGFVPATEAFFSALREQTEKHGALLIYEHKTEANDAYQVITGVLEQEEPLQDLPDVGDKARYYQKFTNGYLSSYTTKIVYQRCKSTNFKKSILYFYGTCSEYHTLFI